VNFFQSIITLNNVLVSARERSFSQAALRLDVTQSALSQHVGKLERAMGTRLFIRRRDGLELTRAGRELFSISDRLIDIEQLVEEKIQAFNQLDEGHLSIVATAPRPAMPMIAAFARRYPLVQISFTLQSWTKCMIAVSDKAVDLAVMTEPEAGVSLAKIPVGNTRYVAYTTKSHKFAGRKQVSLNELVEEPIILPEDGSFTQRIVMEKLKAHELNVRQVIKTTTFPVLKEAVLHGIGIGLFLNDSHFPSEDLVALPIQEMPESYTNFLVTHEAKQDLRLMRSFLDVAQEVDLNTT